MAITQYMVADGSNVVEGSLNVVTPQPRSIGIQATRRTWAADGQIFDEGKYVELIWDALEDVTEYQAVLTAFGINSALTNAVTVGIRDEKFAWVRMNGTAVRPQPGRDVDWQFFPRNVRILVRDLTTAS